MNPWSIHFEHMWKDVVTRIKKDFGSNWACFWTLEFWSPSDIREKESPAQPASKIMRRPERYKARRANSIIAAASPDIIDPQPT